MATHLFYNELKIISYTQRRDVSYFESKTADLNSFLKDDALDSQSKIILMTTMHWEISEIDLGKKHGKTFFCHIKSDKKKFTGYKINSMMFEDVFVTNINATSGNSYDGDLLIPLVDEKIAYSSRPNKIVGDGHYGSEDNQYKISVVRGITLVAPFREDFNPTGLFTQEKFIIEENDVACPAGLRMMIFNYNVKRLSNNYHHPTLN